MKYAHGSNDETQAEVTAFLATELAKLFPTSGIRINTRTVFGECNIYLCYTNASKLEDCWSNIWENDPAYMGFSIQSDDAGFYIEAPIYHSSKARKAAKYRIIKGATEMACAVKLLAWFKKNGTSFLELGLRN